MRPWPCIRRDTHVLQTELAVVSLVHVIAWASLRRIILHYPILSKGGGDGPDEHILELGALSMEISPAFPFHRNSVTRKYLDRFTSIGEATSPLCFKKWRYHPQR